MALHRNEEEIKWYLSLVDGDKEKTELEVKPLENVGKRCDERTISRGPHYDSNVIFKEDPSVYRVICLGGRGKDKN